jgi:leader peptidase (prepilin peptidase)/N-methyltransferase
VPPADAGESADEPDTSVASPEDRIAVVADPEELPDSNGHPPAAVLLAVAPFLCGLALLWVAIGAGWPAGDNPPPVPYAWRAGGGLLALFGLLVAVGAIPRPADTEIIAEIEAERRGVRKAMLLEMSFFLPAMLLGGVTCVYGIGCSNTALLFDAVLSWSPGGGWMPLRGLGTAATGFVVGAGLGWTVRWVATLLLGKEAFGSGDIHMMAAAGCVGGWQVVAIGFLMSSGLALVGVILHLPFKRSRAVPLGPWLSLAFLVTVLFHDAVMSSPPIRNLVFVWQEWVGAG